MTPRALPPLFAGLLAVIVVLALGAGPALAAPVSISLFDPPTSSNPNPSPNVEFSPNGDGQDDAAEIVYCLDGPADVDTTITPEGDSTVVRTLEAGAHHGGGPCPGAGAVLHWDGDDDTGNTIVVPDGPYTLRIHAVGTAGHATPDDATVTLVVNTLVPGSISSPSAGDTVGGSVPVVFHYSSGWNHGGQWQPRVGGSGAPDCVGDPAFSTAGPDTVTVALADCPDGPAAIVGTLQWEDEFGNRHFYESPGVNVTFKKPPEVFVGHGSDPYEVTEGDDGTTSVDVPVTLSEASDTPVSVDWAAAAAPLSLHRLANDSGADADFDAVGGSVVFLPGETSHTVSATVHGDLTAEHDEYFVVALSSPVGAQLGTPADGWTDGAPVLIRDDDLGVFIGNDGLASDAPEGDTGTTTVTIPVELNFAGQAPVTVSWATLPLPANLGPDPRAFATADEDYQAASGTLTFNPGETQKTVDITIIGDTRPEFAGESFQVYMTDIDGAEHGVTPAGFVLGAPIRILDDDPPTISVGDVSVGEGDATATFTLTRSSTGNAHYPNPVSVDWTTENDSATAGSDFTAASGTATFDPSSLTTTVEVPIKDDALDELDETFKLKLTNPQHAVVAGGEGIGTIVDDEEPSLSIDDATVTEGDSGTKTMTFTARLSLASGKTVHVDVATADGSAAAPIDYTAVSATPLTFDPGVTEQTVDVQIKGDGLAEPDETFTTSLSHAQNATIADGQATGTIQDDDVPTVASFTADPNPVSCGAPVSLDASASTVGPGRTIASYAWDFGDGTTGSGRQVSHAYDAFGSHAVKLTVTDNVSNTGTRTVTVDHVNGAPIADAGGPYTVRTGSGVSLDGSGSHDPNTACGDSILSYAWDVNDDHIFNDATGQRPSLTPADLTALGLGTGSHTIVLRVRDTRGGESIDTATLAIGGPPANDDFADAAPLGAGPAAFDTSFAGFEAGEFVPVFGYGSVWFTIAPGPGVLKLHAQAAFASPVSDRRIAVYTGPGIGALDPVVVTSAFVNGGADLAFPTAAGVTYRIQVSGPTGVVGQSPVTHRGEGTLAQQFYAAPANDDFADAAAFGSQSTAAFDTSFATGEAGEPFPGTGRASVWFTIAPGRGVLYLRAQAANAFHFVRRLAVYTSSGIPGAFDTPVAAGLSGQSDGNVEVTFPTAAGVTYHVQVSGPVGFAAGQSLDAIDPGHGAGLLASAFRAAPPNDDFADAEAFLPGQTPFDTTFATNETSEVFPGSGTVWFKIAPGPGVMKLRAQGSTLSPWRLSVYSGSAISALGLPVADASSGPGGDASVAFATAAGVTYRVRVTGPISSSGPVPGAFNLGVGAGTLLGEFHTAPANDDFAGATALGASDDASFDTSSASREPGEVISGPGSASVWFTIAPGRGAVTLRPRGAGGSAFSGGLAVYTGSGIDALNPVANAPTGNVTFRTAGGVTYRVQVTGPTALAGQSPGTINPAAGIGTLTSEFHSAPPNDDFADAAALAAGDTATFDTSLASVQASEPGSLNGDPGTVWYRIAPGGLGRLSFHAAAAFPSTQPLAVSAYSGSSLGTLTLVKNVESSASGPDVVDVPSFGTTCGATYYVRVRGPRAFEGGGFTPGIGAGTLTPSFNPTPLANDAFADAAMLQPGHIDLRDNWWTCATAQASEPAHGGSPAAHSVWYRIAPTGSGKVVLSSPGNRIAVYRGTSVAALTRVPSSASGGDYAFLTPAGNTYLVAVDGGTGTSLDYDFIPGEVAQLPNIPGTATITTDNDGTVAPTPTDPIETSLQHAPSLAAGSTIFETQGNTASSAWTFLGYKVEITAPPLTTPQSPYTITFYVDKSLSATPPTILRNGVAVPPCAVPNSTSANPDPCVSRSQTFGSNPAVGFHLIIVKTTHASEWTFGVPRTTAGTTLGALRTTAGADVAFGVTSNGKTVAGALAYNKGTQHLVSTSVTALAITGKKAWFAGTSTDRRLFLAYVEDNGPGSRDVFKLWIAGVEQTGAGGLKAGDLAVLAKP